MNNERPFEDIIPVPNIKVGYFEKKEYLEIIDRQAKQIESFGDQIMALQSRIDILEKSKRPTGEWIVDYQENEDALFKRGWKCPVCETRNTYGMPPYCMYCGARLEKAEKE